MVKRSFLRLPCCLLLAAVAALSGNGALAFASGDDGSRSISVTLLLRVPGGVSASAAARHAALAPAPSLRERRALHAQPRVRREARLQALRRSRALAAVAPAAERVATRFLPA